MPSTNNAINIAPETQSQQSGQQKYKIALATGTRADWGLLLPVARMLEARPDVELHIFATNMHLLEKYGNTINDIRSEGFRHIHEYPIHETGNDGVAKALELGNCARQTARFIAETAPELMIILGDRSEMMGCAAACATANVPVAHICGGSVSEGAIDEVIRHAITKLSSIHFPETEEFRNRILQMGEQPEDVINAGSLGVWNLAQQPLMSRELLEKSIDWDFGTKSCIVTYHPATKDPADPGEQCMNLLECLAEIPDLKILITYPNNDAGSDRIIEAIETFAKKYPERAKVVPSLGMLRYLSALQIVDFAAGNSSSGIIEMPSAGIPTIDVGIRQQRRLCAKSVIHCSNEPASIREAISTALSPEMKAIAAKKINPYSRPDTPGTIVNAIVNFLSKPVVPKSFNDLAL